MKVFLKRALFLWTALAVVVTVYFSIVRPHPLRVQMIQSESVALRGYGVIDFIQYWSAYRVVEAGDNPYSGEKMREVQSTIGPVEYVTMMWNPPWLLLIMKPVLSLDLHSAVVAWFFINLLFIGVSVWLCTLLYPNGKSWNVLGILALLLFPPFGEALHLGQISILLAVALLAFAVCLQRRWDFAAGAFLSFLSVKPHLIYLVALVLIWWIVKERRFFVLWGGLVGLGGLVLGSLWLQGPLLFQWIDVQVNPDSVTGVVSTSEWMTSTIGGALRVYGGPWFGSHRIEGIVVLFTVLPVLLWLVLSQPRIKWDSALPILLLLSLMTAPYGWYFDTVIAVIAVASCLGSEGERSTLSNAALFTYFAFTGWFLVYIAKFQHQIFFFPVGLLLILYFSKNSSMSDPQVRSQDPQATQRLHR